MRHEMFVILLESLKRIVNDKNFGFECLHSNSFEIPARFE